MKFDKNLMSFVSKDLKHGKVPFLVGEPGIGKSSWCEALAELNQTKCFTVAVNQLADKADLTGARLVPIENTDGSGCIKGYKQVFYPHADIMDAIFYAEEHPRENVILFLDEINRTTADVTSAALSVPTSRRIGSIKLPSNLRVIIAGNDKGNITSLDEASISRFVIYRVEPDTETFINIEINTLNPYVKTVLQRNPEFIFCKKLDTVVSGKTTNDDDDDNDNNNALLIEDILSDSEGMAQISAPRTIKAVSDWLNEFSSDEILQASMIPAVVDGVDTTLFMEGVVGHCGYTTFAVCLVDEIMKNVNQLSSNTAAKGPQKPNCYDALKASPDIDALVNYIQGLNDAEKSASILYAICEKTDNTLMLQKLCEVTTKMSKEDIGMLITQIGLEAYDVENMSVVTSSGTRVGDSLDMFVTSTS
jgi:energy-coupling factor transporter ATP-binding protein EcfA2